MSAENNLLDMVKRNKNKYSYVTTKLNEISKIINKIGTLNDAQLIEYLITLTYNKFKNNLQFSQLTSVEKSHLCNALRTRCIKKIMTYN